MAQFTPSRQGSPIIPKATGDGANGSAQVPDTVTVLAGKDD